MNQMKIRVSQQWNLFSFMILMMVMAIKGEEYITIKFYSAYWWSSSNCAYDYYGVGVKPDTCVHHGSTTAKFSCSSSGGFKVTEYSTSDCSGSGTTTTISTKIDVCAASSSWSSTSYFQKPPVGYHITCSDDKYVSILFFFISMTFLCSGPRIIRNIQPHALLTHLNQPQLLIIVKILVLILVQVQLL